MFRFGNIDHELTRSVGGVAPTGVRNPILCCVQCGRVRVHREHSRLTRHVLSPSRLVQSNVCHRIRQFPCVRRSRCNLAARPANSRIAQAGFMLTPQQSWSSSVSFDTPDMFIHIPGLGGPYGSSFVSLPWRSPLYSQSRYQYFHTL